MIIHYEDLADIRARYRKQTIVYASGCFDILHPGHVRLVQHLETLGDIVVVGVTPDARVRRKGPERPINPQESRVEMVDALKPVDFAFITPESVPGVRVAGHYVLEQLQPDIYVTDDPAWHADEAMLRARNTEIRPGPKPLPGTSTTEIINLIVGRYIQ